MRGLGFKKLFDDIYCVLAQSYRDLGNESISLNKALEPLCVGHFLKLYREDANDHKFLDDILSLHNKLQNGSAHIASLCRVMDDYLQTHGRSGIPSLIEQYGQEKLHNYPIVFIEDGLTKMFNYGTEFTPFKRHSNSCTCFTFQKGICSGLF